MGTSFLNQWFSRGEIQATCWTLIHSLWIGMIIALLAALVIMLTRKSSAGLRYRLLCGILVLFVLSVSVIFYIEVRSTGAVKNNPNNVKFFINPVNVNITAHSAVTPHVNPVKVVVNFLDSYVNIIFVVWLLFFIMKSLKMASGLLYIQRIRNYRVHEVAEEFKHKINHFSSQIGIRQTVRLVQSELVKVPVAVGWLKPVILLPIGIIFQLTPEQLDSILWHELAHIRRRDYLVNILQGLVETVFFFNPGLLWLSSLIRAEREACCDDIVMSRMTHKANYLEALLSFGFGENKQAGLAMGIGSGNQLRDRLKRMVNQENKRLSIAEKAVLCVGLVLVSAFTTLSKDNPVIKHFTVKYISKSGKVVSKDMAVSVHRLPEGQRAHDRTPQSRERNTIIVTDTSIRFTSVLFKNSDADMANNVISAMDANGKKYNFTVADDKLVAMNIDGVKVAENDLPGYQYMITYINRTVAEKRRVRYDDIAAYKANSPSAKFKDKNTGDFDKRRYSLAQQKADEKGPDPRYMKDAAMVKRQRDDSIGYAKEVERMHNIIADLVKAKVIANRADVKWFGLSDTELIVNGIKQPNELQERLKVKYGVHENYGLYYGPVEMTGTGVFINEDADNRNLHMLNFQRERDMQLKLHTQQLSDNQSKFQQLRDEQLKFKEYQIKTQERILQQMSINQQKWQKEKELTLKQSEKHGAKYVNATKKSYQDTNMLKLQQLIKQQKAFVAKQSKDREQLIKQQQILVNEQNENRERIVNQQESFVANEDGKRRQLIKEQQRFADEQNRNRDQIQKQQQILMDEQDKTMAQLKRRNGAAFQSKIPLPEIMANITGDLVSENIVKDKSDLTSFNLTNTFLVVNGIMQSDEIHEKLKNKYLIQPKYDSLNQQVVNDPNFGLHYDATNHGMGIGILIDKDTPPGSKTVR